MNAALPPHVATDEEAIPAPGVRPWDGSDMREVASIDEMLGKLKVFADDEDDAGYVQLFRQFVAEIHASSMPFMPPASSPTSSGWGKSDGAHTDLRNNPGGSMKRLRRRDIRASRQAAQRERGAIDHPVSDHSSKGASPALANPAITEARSGEVLASMQMRSRVLELICAEAERLEAGFGRDDEAATLRDIEAEVRALPPSPASITGDVEDLVTEVAISITYALEATNGMPMAYRVEEMARAALFLPSRLSSDRG